MLACLLIAVALSGCASRRAVEPLPLLPPVQEVVYPPVSLPSDDAPHDGLTEWWYYTGHLVADTGERYGFEYVTFQAVRGSLPVAYVGHLAVTDQQRGTFQYDHRVTLGQRLVQEDSFDLSVEGWRMRGNNGFDQLNASMGGYAIDLALQSTKPPVLQDEDGLIRFGDAGDSYYVSRTRMEVTGTIVDQGVTKRVTGLAWFDHQWGNFLVLGGGWDWISANLDDGSDLMVNTVRDDHGTLLLAYGTYVDPSGGVRHLSGGDFTIEPRGSWVSPRSGARYPSGWSVRVNEPLLELVLEPVLLDQELITAGTTGQTYWEGQNRVSGLMNGRPISGMGYVELTGYASR
jgi:predicted secreted hydrolase